jgi:hypothetical protein
MFEVFSEMNRYRRLEEMMNAEGLSDQEVNYFLIFNVMIEICFDYRKRKNVIYMQQKKRNIYV